MLDFEAYVSRHGEPGMQALIERLERSAGIRAVVTISLQDRWNAVMGNDNLPPYHQRLAA